MQYKTLAQYYAANILTVKQTAKVKAFLQNALANCTNLDDAASLQHNLNTCFNNKRMQIYELDSALLRYDTIFRESLCAKFALHSKTLYNKMQKNSNTCLIDLY